jgi:hypothetical protein
MNTLTIHTYLDRCWDISQNGIVSPVYNLTVGYNENELVGPGSEASLLPIKYSVVNSAGVWYKPTGSQFTDGTFLGTASINTTANTFTWSGLNSFSFVGVVGDEASSLPIDLLYFKANLDGKKVRLDWATGSEQNVDYFIVERSRNGKEFTKVFQTPAKGQSSNLVEYLGFDTAPMEGLSYYRLKEVDADGKIFYSDLSSVMIGIQTPLYSVYPNPVQDHLINFEIPVEEDLSIELYDAVGKLVLEGTIKNAEGSNKTVVNLPSNIAVGSYQMTLKNIQGEIVDNRPIIIAN